MGNGEYHQFSRFGIATSGIPTWGLNEIGQPMALADQSFNFGDKPI
jgi:hypothetical protein